MYDAIVIGVGGMGSAALYHLSLRGARVLGLEQFDIPNDRGSSHGITRIIRLAYWEHPDYVPLVRRAYTLWRELERDTGERLLVITGCVDAGPGNSAHIAGVRHACAAFNSSIRNTIRMSSTAGFPVIVSLRTRLRSCSLRAASSAPNAARRLTWEARGGAARRYARASASSIGVRAVAQST